MSIQADIEQVYKLAAVALAPISDPYAGMPGWIKRRAEMNDFAFRQLAKRAGAARKELELLTAIAELQNEAELLNY